MQEIFIAILLISLLLLFQILGKSYCGQEGLTSRPTDAEKKYLIGELLNNKELFSSKTMADAKNKFEWIDAVTYEEARKLALSNKFNAENIEEILR